MTTTTTKHTPTPWYKDNSFINFDYTDSDGNRYHGTICELGLRGSIQSANAAFIVRAVNSHDRLVEALRGFVNLYLIADGRDEPKAIPDVLCQWRNARAILAELDGDKEVMP